jgi:hypothetical protein
MARLNNAEFEALSSEYKDIEKESKNIKSQEDLNAFNNKIALWERKKQSALKSREYLEKRFNHVIKQAEDDTEKLELFKYNYNDWDKSMSNLIGGTKRIAAGSVKLLTQGAKAIEEKTGLPASPFNNMMSDISDEILDEVKKDSEQYRRLEFKDVNNWSDFGQYMAQLTTEQLPIYGAMLLGGRAGLYAVSASSGGDKIKEMEDEPNKQYSQTEKLFAGLGYAAGEYFPEKFGTFKMLNDFKDTYRTLSSTNRKLFADGLAKTIVTQSTKPLKEGLREGTTELITSKVQQAVDRLLLDKPMTAKQMLDQDLESFIAGAFGGAKMSAAGQLFLAPKVIRQLSDRTSIEKTQQLVAEIENLNTELLDNPNLTDQDKKVIQEKIIDLSNQSLILINRCFPFFLFFKVYQI